LTQFYGLRPEDIDRMTWREVSEYLVQLRDYEIAEEARNGR
jgi:hypothetical protein